MAHILVIEKQPSARLALRRFLESEGHTCEAVGDVGPTGEPGFDLAVIDADALPEPDGENGETPTFPARHVIVLSREAPSPWVGVASVFGSVGKPLDFRELGKMVDRCLEAPAEIAIEAAAEPAAAGRILTQSSAMRRVLEEIARLAPHDITVLITGESGTGKELVARALHDQSPRSGEPFEAIHCGAIPPDLLESELFGHERGSFTDAHRTKIGRFEAAGAGTIFLDEIGEMPLALQVKLLRALQEREIQRIGGLETIEVRARIVAATNRDLRQRASAGEFREDLLHRLQVAILHLPPLRERPQDVDLLASEFLGRCARKFHRPTRGISPEGADDLRRRPWPGNVRQLQNVIERAVVLSRSTVLGLEDLDDPVAPTEHLATPEAWEKELDREIGRRIRKGEDLDSIRTQLQAAVDRAVESKTRSTSPPKPASLDPDTIS